MESLKTLGMDSKEWRFLHFPKKYVEASQQTRRLQEASTERQFRTARDILERLNGTNGKRPQKGLLLADDVGLGKTTVAALVAWIVAARKETGGTVRILVPNDVMRGRWEQELKDHVEPLKQQATHLVADELRVKSRRGERLTLGSIQIVKHSYAVAAAATKKKLSCDLLIVDEAHRAKGRDSNFSRALRTQAKWAKRVLILTATPFSIHIKELLRLIRLVGGTEAATKDIGRFSKEIDQFYQCVSRSDTTAMAQRLSQSAQAAIEALAPFVIRHGIDDLPREQKVFGRSSGLTIAVPTATDTDLDLMLRMDRALQLAGAPGSRTDPRFHVGWSHFDDVLKNITVDPKLPQMSQTVLRRHQVTMKEMRRKSGRHHPKMVAVGQEVIKLVEQGEKCVLFCKHHATARELSLYLDAVASPRPKSGLPGREEWKKEWQRIIPEKEGDQAYTKASQTFIDWLISEPIRAQIWRWIPRGVQPGQSLDDLLQESGARGVKGAQPIAMEAKRLFNELWNNKSSRGVLRSAADAGELRGIPGATGKGIVLGICHDVTALADRVKTSRNRKTKPARGASGRARPESILNPNQRPDMALAFFNSPFGPDVLVVTDKLSEGVDLHRYCRHLIHYELNPSPIATIQRNGRVRRVDSWASVTRKEIMYSYPAFYGTRDHRLVQIVKKRIQNFSLLLGGVQDFDDADLIDDVEQWRNEVLVEVQKMMKKFSGRLCAMRSKSS